MSTGNNEANIPERPVIQKIEQEVEESTPKRDEVDIDAEEPVLEEEREGEAAQPPQPGPPTRVFPEAQPPLFICPQTCVTCGKDIATLRQDFVRERIARSGGKETELPLRMINPEELSKKGDDTAEMEILDNLGVIRYCCRRMIMTQPSSKVPPPTKSEIQSLFR